MTRWRLAIRLAANELRIERRRRTMVSQVIPFAVVTMVIFGLGFGGPTVTAGSGSSPLSALAQAGPGLVWVTVVLSLIITVQHSFAVDTADGALDALRVAGVDPAAIFWGKTLAIGVQLIVLATLVSVTAVVIASIEMSEATPVLGLVAIVIASIGLAAVGVLYGALTVGGSGRGALLALLVFPAVSPVVIAGTRALEASLGSYGVPVSQGWSWIGLLTVFAGGALAIGTLAFGSLIDGMHR
ncbi:MAG: hypothetical protein CSA55_05730 [Ilumatobacter coccineus]|uniref:Heme exporter protein B n=1 Tax=Ilumatobacter coccineus TaxID=467094 RepID=A0A2G6K6Z8_9ACTN|nr:MAG: hypothetical protein CSA55_05730 [Ilumatobacter coccineus]